MLWSVDTCYKNKVSADKYHVTISRAYLCFEVDRLRGAGFSIGSRAHVRLTCCNQGWVVRKLVSVNRGLKVNRSINLSPKQILFTAFDLCILISFKLPSNTYKTSQQS